MIAFAMPNANTMQRLVFSRSSKRLISLLEAREPNVTSCRSVPGGQ